MQPSIADQAEGLPPVRGLRPRWIGVVAALLIVLAGALVLLGPGLVEARRWALSDAQVRWIPGWFDGLPYRPTSAVHPRPLSDWSLNAPERVQAYHAFQTPPGAQKAMTVLLPVVEGEVALFVNNVPVETQASVETGYLALTGARTVIWRAPDYVLRPGHNRLDIVVTGARHRGFGAPIVLAAGDGADGLHATLISVTGVFRGWLPGLAMLAAWLALAAAVALRRATPWVALSAASSALGARTAVWSPVGPDWLDIYAPLLDQTALCAVLTCVACACIGAAPEPSRQARRGIVAWAALLLLLAGMAVFGVWRGDRVLETAALALPPLGLLLLIWAGVRAVRAPSTGTPAERAAEGAGWALLGVTAAAAVVGASGLGWGLWVPWLDVVYGLGVFMLLGGLVVSAGFLAAREVWRWVRDRPRLNRIISKQREEIEAAALALRQQERRSAVLEERQRLSRDMHDGIGGQLMSLLARVRSRRITPEQLEGELTSGLSELRLMVDSLDASDGSVADALAVLRSRIRTQTEAARMSLEWSQSEDLNDITGDPHWILNLNRLIQEAVTNAVRHAKADHLSVSIMVADDRRLMVTIRDNGVGFERDRVRPGRGLSNLTFRAAQMAGGIEIGRDGAQGGAVIRADLAMPQMTGRQSSDEIMPS